MTDFDLTERTVLVTGATHGIGAEIARRAFARSGARVAIAGRDVTALDALERQVSELGGEVAFSGGYDLPEREQVYALADDVRAVAGDADVLVNNAGVGRREDLRPVAAFDSAFWDLTLALNLTAPFLRCRALVPGMVLRGFGWALNVASINGRAPSSQASAYVASKHGMIGLARALALEVVPHGITANAVCPGPVDVGDDRRLAFDAGRSERSTAELEAVLTPKGGRLAPADIAPPAVFLASPGAASITGQALHVDRCLVMA
jgi:NAD(P)-dependent dehydrogenase (short-subunit alcohol dehydrogenase family)